MPCSSCSGGASSSKPAANVVKPKQYASQWTKAYVRPQGSTATVKPKKPQ